MNAAKWAGVFAAVLVVGCAGQQSETRTTATNPRADAQSGSARDATAANEQAPSQRPTSGVGSQVPHPVATDRDDPKYGGDENKDAGTVARPGFEGRPGYPQEGSAATGMQEETKELREVYGQVNEVSDDTLEIEPAYGDPIKLKLDEAGTQANAGELQEGEEVRASYERQGDENVAVDLKTGSDAEPLDISEQPDASEQPGAPMKSEPSTTGGTMTR